MKNGQKLLGVITLGILAITPSVAQEFQKAKYVQIPDTTKFLGISNICITTSNLTGQEIFYGYTNYDPEVDGKRFSDSHNRPAGGNGGLYAFLVIDFGDKLEFHSYSQMDHKGKGDVMIVTSDKKHNIQLGDYSVESNDKDYLPGGSDKVGSSDPLQIPITSFDGINGHSQYFLI